MSGGSRPKKNEYARYFDDADCVRKALSHSDSKMHIYLFPCLAEVACVAEVQVEHLFACNRNFITKKSWTSSIWGLDGRRLAGFVLGEHIAEPSS